jgi:hypothetical protein
VQTQTKEIIKEAYLVVIACAWMAAFGATIYFLMRAVFYHSAWWHAFVSAAVAWVLYQVSMHYGLED